MVVTGYYDCPINSYSKTVGMNSNACRACLNGKYLLHLKAICRILSSRSYSILQGHFTMYMYYHTYA